MSDKSFLPFSRLLSDGLLGNLTGSGTWSGSGAAQTSRRNVPLSRGFEIFLQNANKAATKYEIEQIIRRELQSSQQSLSQPGLSLTQTRDHLCRIVYGHMLGYDVSEGYIHAVKLAQQGTGVDKKVGYLVTCLLLHRDHELILLLINTIQRDLKSSNILDNMAALCAASQLVPMEMIPTLLPLVLEKLKHSRELVRQKAVMCVYQFQLLAPDLLAHIHDDLQRALYDKDPGVMAMAVYLIHNNIQRDPGSHGDMATSLISILRQIVSHKLSTMFEYHAIPFPWLQIQLLRCLAILGKVHKDIRSELSSLLKEILQRTNMKENISFAILYECIQCIVALEPERSLLDQAMEHVGRFLRSNDSNLKYIGVKALVAIVQVDRQYALNHQSLIVQSLETTDLSIQRKMYRLLYEIANKTNVEAVCSKFLQQLSSTTDKHWRAEVITMVINMAERYVSSSQWLIDTLLICVQLGADQSDHSVTQRVIAILRTAYMTGSAEQMSQQVLVQRTMRLLVADGTLPSLIQISAWVVGELCSLLKNMPDDRVISLFTKHLCDPELPYCVKTSLLSGLQKLIQKKVVQSGVMVTKLAECLAVEQVVVVKQRLSVLLGVCRQDMRLEEDDQPDLTLSFLDDYVSLHTEMGRMPFVPVHLRGPVAKNVPDMAAFQPEPSLLDDSRSGGSHFNTTSSVSSLTESDVGLKLQGVRKVWSKHGRLDTSTELEESLIDQECESVQTDEDKHHQDLTAALFSGLHGTKESKETTNWLDEDDLDLCNTSSDTAGWKSVHTALTEPSPDVSLVTSDRPIGNGDHLGGTSNQDLLASDNSLSINHEIPLGTASSNTNTTNVAGNTANNMNDSVTAVTRPAVENMGLLQLGSSKDLSSVPHMDTDVPHDDKQHETSVNTVTVPCESDTNSPVDSGPADGNNSVESGARTDEAMSALLTEHTNFTSDPEHQSSSDFNIGNSETLLTTRQCDENLFGDLEGPSDGAGVSEAAGDESNNPVTAGMSANCDASRTGCDSLYSDYNPGDSLYGEDSDLSTDHKGETSGTIYDIDDT